MAEIYHGRVNLSYDVDHKLTFWLKTNRKPKEIWLYFYGTSFAKESFYQTTEANREYLNKMEIAIDGQNVTERIEGYLASPAGGEWKCRDLGDGTKEHDINSKNGMDGGTENGIPLLNFPDSPLVELKPDSVRHVIRFFHPKQTGGSLYYVLKVVYGSDDE